jgi:hypothetical protein
VNQGRKKRVNRAVPSAGHDEFPPSSLNVEGDFERFLRMGGEGKFCGEPEVAAFFLQEGKDFSALAPAGGGVDDELDLHGSLKRNIWGMPGMGL